MSRLTQKAFFVLRYRGFRKLKNSFTKAWFQLIGMRVGKGTALPHIFVTWPHQVSLGSDCRLEHHIYFKFDGIWKPGPAIRIGDRVFIGSGCEFNINVGIEVGQDTLIASGCRFIDHDHGMKLGELMRRQQGTGAAISLGQNVWLGCNVVVLKGVTIGDGAIVAAGSVVTKSISENEIWGGVPAKKIGDRR